MNPFNDDKVPKTRVNLEKVLKFTSNEKLVFKLLTQKLDETGIVELGTRSLCMLEYQVVDEMYMKRIRRGKAGLEKRGVIAKALKKDTFYVNKADIWIA